MTWKEDEVIGELLALLHGDGGHYYLQHGLEKARRDACRRAQFELGGTRGDTR